jgi:hypothetical protein
MAGDERRRHQLKAHTLRTVVIANLSMAVAFAGIAFTAA